MRTIRRTLAATVGSGLLAVGAFTALTVAAGPANAGVAGSCTGSGAPISCTITNLVISLPQSIELDAMSSPTAQTVDLQWSSVCSQGGQTKTESGGDELTTDAFESVILGFTNPDSCAITATATLPGTNSTAANAPRLTLNADYNPQPGAGSSSPSPSASASSTPPTGVTGPIKGFDSKCVDDRANSSSLRATVQTWSCNGDKAQSWKYASGELMHNGLCLNVKGNAGSGGRVILWTCTRSANEQWIYQLNSTFVLLAHNFTLCLDDPGYSTRNGTQLMVYTCHNSPNQHWTIP